MADPKLAIVTGANTGIGKVTARVLAERGMRVIIACRSIDKGQAAVDDIRRESGSESVELVRLDLGSLAQVAETAAALAEHERIDLLINNAGLAGQRGLTSDGFEMAFGVNHLGHFALTLPLLANVAAAGGRVVHVASKAHTRPSEIDWSRLTKPTKSLTGFPEYGVSKLANVLFSNELARRVPDVLSISLHPGVVASDVWRRVPWPIRPLMTRGMLTVEEGAATTLHCATSDDVTTGKYYDDSREAEMAPLARDTALAKELWQRSEEWTGVSLARAS